MSYQVVKLRHNVPYYGKFKYCINVIGSYHYNQLVAICKDYVTWLESNYGEGVSYMYGIDDQCLWAEDRIRIFIRTEEMLTHFTLSHQI